ncbi:MAG: hypothetical protein OEU56_24175, partial [Rhodospirillales bacterium]|nr:hypothetical protein [Rhodospirillales bacterium]
ISMGYRALAGRGPDLKPLKIKRFHHSSPSPADLPSPKRSLGSAQGGWIAGSRPAMTKRK